MTWDHDDEIAIGGPPPAPRIKERWDKKFKCSCKEKFFTQKLLDEHMKKEGHSVR